ncbi:MAG: hypothetical protein G8237_00130 [Magnetococcales bacterium]|nr:hypothetical protein [Magnetococcales bacterium]
MHSKLSFHASSTVHRKGGVSRFWQMGVFNLTAATPAIARLVLASRRWKRDVWGGMARRIHQGLHDHVIPGTRRCPDGQHPHPTVCHRGWRGDLCQGCISAH